MSQILGTTTGGGTITGVVVQKKVVPSSLQDTTNGVIPIDNTIPQITEGTEYMSTTFTPTSATNILLITFVSQGYNDGSGMTVALFQDSNADAIACINPDPLFGLTDGSPSLVLTHAQTAGTTSSITFSIRYGGTDPGITNYMLRSLNLATFGGIMRSYLIIEELQT